MNLFLAFVLVAVLIIKHTDAMPSGGDDKLDKAEKSKKEFEDEKKKDSVYGKKKIEESGIDEDEFGKILTWIRDAQICLRRGTEAKNAAYALSDFDLDLSQVMNSVFWFIKPYTKNVAKTNLWYERLYNSVAKILLSEKEEKAPLLLATKGGDAEGEKYAAVRIGIGDTKSFGKTQVKGEKVSKDFELNVEESLNDLPDAVEKVLKWIESTFKEALSQSE